MVESIIKSKYILEGQNLELKEDRYILVEDNVIKEIDSIDNLEKYNLSEYDVIDLGEKYLLPGLIECHTHLVMSATEPGHLETVANLNEAEMAINSLHYLKLDLNSGITTSRSLGDKNDIEFTMKRLVASGRVAGPDLYISGSAIRSTNGFSYLGIPHNGPEEVRKTIRENFLKGADYVKLFTTPGMLNPGQTFIPSNLSKDEIKIAVDEAHRQGKFVVAHCIGGQALKDCVESGVDVLEHLYFVSDEDIKLLKDSDVWIGYTSGIYLDEGREEFLSDQTIRKVRYYRENVRNNLTKLIRSNIKFALGTDAYHGNLYKEAIIANELGADKLQCLLGMTVNAAKSCQIDDIKGQLTEGYNADIIAVNTNPLSDLNSLANVNFVMKGGKIYKK